MPIQINEPVKVGAVFGGKDKIKPRWFIWKGRRYFIKEVNYIWTEMVGRAKVHHFSVSDDSDIYELLYNTESMVWKLGGIDDEGAN